MFGTKLRTGEIYTSCRGVRRVLVRVHLRDEREKGLQGVVPSPPHTHRAMTGILLIRALGVNCIQKRLGTSQFRGQPQVPDIANHLRKSTPASAPRPLAEIHPRIMVPSLSCTSGTPCLGLREAKGECEPFHPCTSVSGCVQPGDSFN